MLQNFTVLGDSLLVINWVNQIQIFHISHLMPILEEVLRIITAFDSINFSHIYREHNKMADRISKEASQLDYGSWHIPEHSTWCSFDYHRPLQDGLL
jgi:hypothetical protein